ncbi:histidine kinase [Arcicella aquatica]|uniref:Histidine kinase n=1 Tax=Arcicella aquatica TaxID=217141 RepID=A0ABU5QJ12_9BACT|nr:histidine kinase [Arcicella aquatica]MEA5257056.1 histidine kinase [Arcicella aquatica]
MEKNSELFLKIYPIGGISAKRRILLHCVFWIMMFIGLWEMVSRPLAGIFYNLLSTLYCLITDVIFFYLIVYLIAPLWDNNYKYRYFITLLYSVIIVISVAIFFYIRVQLIFDYDLLKEGNLESRSLSVFYNNFWFIFKSGFIVSSIITIFFFTLPAFFIKLIHSLVKSISEKKQVEIDYLRSQINPHFLTNTLNNIYSLSVTDDKRNSDAILSLSSLLDYVLYEANHPTISLEKEVSFLSNFIELEKMRNTKRLQVSFEIQGDIHGSIPPMILITFVENAFKHSIGDLFSNCFINILLKVENEKLYFEVQNSKSNLIANNNKKTFGGIGLTNVKKRLSTLFPNTHSLQIKNEENVYTIDLQLGLM